MTFVNLEIQNMLKICCSETDEHFSICSIRYAAYHMYHTALNFTLLEVNLNNIRIVRMRHLEHVGFTDLANKRCFIDSHLSKGFEYCVPINRFPVHVR